jgi:hypothetical protein
MSIRKPLLLLSLLLISINVSACSCSLGDVKEKFASHESVFEGTVTEINYYDLEDAFGDQVIKVKFNVLHQWKGSLNQTELLTVDNRRSCYGHSFKEKQSYLIYAFIERDHLNAWWCGGVLEKEPSESYKEETHSLDKLAKKHDKSRD